jgi:hypothetical protein
VKTRYIIGILAILLFAVSSASATIINYDITASNTGKTISITVTYDTDTGKLHFVDPNYMSSTQGILGIAYNAGSALSITTVPSTNNWIVGGGPQGYAQGGLGDFTTKYGKTSSSVYKEVTVQFNSPYPIAMSENTVHNYVAVHYKWNAFDNNGNAITGFGSQGKTTPIPEFPTIAIPVAAILGLMLILGRRKND